MNIVQLFEQNKVWVTAYRIPLRLTEMDAEHRANTLAMLRRRAAYQMMMYFRVKERNEILRMLRFGGPDDDGMGDMFDQRALEEDPKAWLERRPLVMELARLVKLDEDAANTVDGEIVGEKVEIGDALRMLAEAHVCMNAHEYPHGCTDSCYRVGSGSE